MLERKKYIGPWRILSLVLVDRRYVVRKAENKVKAVEDTGTILRYALTKDNLRILMLNQVVSQCQFKH